MINSVIRIPWEAIFSQASEQFSDQNIKDEIYVSPEEKKHFVNLLGESVTGCLIPIGVANSVSALFGLVSKNENFIDHLGVAAPIISEFLFQEWENPDFPRLGTIWLAGSDFFPDHQREPGSMSGTVVCVREEGDSVWTIKKIAKQDPRARSGDYLLWFIHNSDEV